MKIAIVKETEDLEKRVAGTPESVQDAAQQLIPITAKLNEKQGFQQSRNIHPPCKLQNSKLFESNY